MGLFRKRNPNNPNIMQSAVIALLRHLLTFIGGTLVAKGILDSAAMTEVIGAIISILSVSWMAISKYKAPAEPKP